METIVAGTANSGRPIWAAY